MFKKANNDTIVVIKDGYVLKFKLPNSEDQGRDFPPKSFSEFKENAEKALKDLYEWQFWGVFAAPKVFPFNEKTDLM